MDICSPRAVEEGVREAFAPLLRAAARALSASRGGARRADGGSARRKLSIVRERAAKTWRQRTIVVSRSGIHVCSWRVVVWSWCNRGVGMVIRTPEGGWIHGEFIRTGRLREPRGRLGEGPRMRIAAWRA